jgi:hypothetical protein
LPCACSSVYPRASLCNDQAHYSFQATLQVCFQIACRLQCYIHDLHI